MKRLWIWTLLAALLLTGCASTASRHPEWEEGWTPMGDAFAVEPAEGFALQETNDVLSASGLYYATWACGEPRDFVNAEGKDAKVFDAQIYVLLKECANGDAASQEVASWIAREKESYETAEAENQTFGGQKFDVLPLISGKENNPYGFGIAAFAARGDCAISVELVCTDRFTGDPQAVLTEFLNGFHYSA